ncbi:MAG: hypothetical protein M5U01_00185 [Ardenticatenaceae bacterium]|nr:hypothetical protein [Ardenticatenaceae bacterium]
MGETRPPDPVEQRAATLILKLGLKGAEKYERVRLELETARLKRSAGADVAVSLEGKRLELQAKLDFVETVEFTAPSGSYEALILILGSVSGLPDRGLSWVELASVAAVTIAEPIDLKRDAEAAISIVRDLDEILFDSRPDDEREEAMERWHYVDTARPATIRLNQGSIGSGRRAWADVRLRPDTFELGTGLSLRRGAIDALPELFRGQRPLGPVLEITASSAPRGWLDITLSYSPEELARSGFESKDIVVLQFLRDRRQYREIPPYRVDTANHTVSVRVNSLSAFFACSPGILVNFPRLQINAAGEVVAYEDARETQIAGRVVDGRTDAFLLTQVSRTSWTSQGWFVFEDVPLEPSDTAVTIVAGGHFCDFTIRRGLPTKTITRPNTPFAGTPGFGDEGTVFVATVLRQTVDTAAVEGIDALRNFLSSVERNIPTMFWFNADADQWESFRLLSDRFYENEFARLAIDEIARNLRREVPVNPDYPEEVRYLRSLADFVAGLNETNARFGLAVIINVVAQLFGADNLSVSSRLPVVTLTEGHVGCAFVAASYNGWRASTRSSVGSYLRRRHVPRQADRRAGFGLSVLAGRLFYVRASRDSVVEVEVVADDLLCSALSMKVNHALGQPAILAIGLPPEDGAGYDESMLLLFQRQRNGQWTREVVWQGQPIIDADMDFGFGDRPFVVAAVENRNEELNADLYYLPPQPLGPGWAPRPLTWNLVGFPVNTQLGMWPRIVISSWPPEELGTIYCGFTFFTEHTVFWLAGTPDRDGRWQVVEAGQGTRASLAAASNLAPPPQGFADDVVGFSRVSPYHWASSIAPRSDGSIWYAFGNGVLHLARFNGTNVTNRIVDIDRTTGFLPQLATRESAPGSFNPPGAPVIGYKDVHGASTFNAASGIEFATGLDLQFYDLATSHQVPQVSPPDVPAPVGAPVPRRSYAQAFLNDFGTRVPFTCGRFTSYVGIVILSALSGSGLSSAEQQRLLDETQSSIFMNSPIDIHARPEEGLLEITIHNDKPNEPDAIRSMRLRQRTGGRTTLIVTDSTGTEGEGACGLMQDSWDAIAGNFINVPLDPTSLFPMDGGIRARDVRLDGIRMSSPQPPP